MRFEVLDIAVGRVTEDECECRKTYRLAGCIHGMDAGCYAREVFGELLCALRVYAHFFGHGDAVRANMCLNGGVVLEMFSEDAGWIDRCVTTVVRCDANSCGDPAWRAGEHRELQVGRRPTNLKS